MTEIKTSAAMTHITMRIPVKTWEYFQTFVNPRTEMREVLVAYAKERNECD
jgi:hypothetical protein